MSANPVLTQQAQIDKTVCQGETQKAAMSGVTWNGGGLLGAVASAAERSKQGETVMQGCMAQRGYVYVPEKDAAATAAAFAATAAQRQQTETPAKPKS